MQDGQATDPESNTPMAADRRCACLRRSSPADLSTLGAARAFDSPRAAPRAPAVISPLRGSGPMRKAQNSNTIAVNHPMRKPAYLEHILTGNHSRWIRP